MKPDFILPDFLPYLINRAGVQVTDLFSRDLTRFKMTLPMWRVLAALRQSGEQRLRELADMTSIEVSTLSRTVANMERRELLQRHRSGTDARALSLTLTAKGQAMTEQLIPIAQQYEDTALRGFSAAEVKQLKRLLVKTYANMKAVERERSLVKTPDAAA